MKIRMLNTMWRLDDGFRCQLHFGEVAGKHAEAFIPCHRNTPTGQEFVGAHDDSLILFAGTKAPEGNKEPVKMMWLVSEDRFQVIKVPQQGRRDTFLIRAGEDKTPRVLLFIGANSPRGKVTIFSAETNCMILEECVAGNQSESRIDVAAILGPGQQIAFRVWSEERNSDIILIYNWNSELNEVCLRDRITWKEWDSRMRLNELVADPKAVVL